MLSSPNREPKKCRCLQIRKSAVRSLRLALKFNLCWFERNAGPTSQYRACVCSNPSREKCAGTKRGEILTNAYFDSRSYLPTVSTARLEQNSPDM